jgi:hypothetical protein
VIESKSRMAFLVMETKPRIVAAQETGVLFASTFHAIDDN